MKIISPSVEIIKEMPAEQMLDLLYRCGRTCYLSEPKLPAEEFIRRRIKEGHESVIEHGKITAIIVCDRGVLAEITRHRIASFSVESTRYCNYGKDKFGNEITVIKPCFLQEGTKLYNVWYDAQLDSEGRYLAMLSQGAKPEEARSVLTNSLKTTIAMTGNLREWRHFFKLRLDRAAHLQMREVAGMLLDEMYGYIPVIFEDIVEYNKSLSD